jgi:hypothetical protein
LIPHSFAANINKLLIDAAEGEETVVQHYRSHKFPHISLNTFQIKNTSNNKTEAFQHKQYRTLAESNTQN